MNSIRFGILWLIVALVIASGVSAQPRFYRDDPLKTEPRVDVRAKPGEVKLSATGSAQINT